jgi:hypothetical protein
MQLFQDAQRFIAVYKSALTLSKPRAAFRSLHAGRVKHC